MTPRPHDRRLLFLATSALTLLAAVCALPNTTAGQNAAAAKPDTAVDLLTATPFDRMTLTDNSLLRVDPVFPRPLPPYESKKRDKERIPREGNIRLPGEKAEPEKADEDEDDASWLVIHLYEGEIRAYKVKRNNVKSVESYEDMLLAEADRLILARDFSRAFEYLLKVRERSPNWRGLDERVNRHLFSEGNAALLDGDGERGLRLLGELSLRKNDYPGLADKLATSYGTRAARAFELGLYARGRRILHDVEPMAPGHLYLKQVREQFVRRAQELTDAGAKAHGAARLDKIAEALRVWPAIEGGEAAYKEAFTAEPTLDVAVDDVPRGIGPWQRSPADVRVGRLLYLPVLASDTEEAMQGKVPGQLATGMTTTDLGRRLVVQLRGDVLWSDGSRPVSSIDVARALTDAADPSSPRYTARWADLLDRVEAPDTTHVEVRLTRVFLKPGAWLLGPVGPAHAAGDGRLAASDRGRELVDSGSFRWVGSSPGRLEIRAAEPAGSEASGEKGPRAGVKRVKEVRYANAAQTLGAFTRGEVSLVEHVPPDRVAGLAANPMYKVGRYTRPRLHRIALDGRTPALRNRNLRRGLSYAIDRRRLLEEGLLGRPPDEVSLPSDGVFPRGNYADALDVKALPYDPGLARMLVAAARKELGQPITLKLEYPAIPEAQTIVPKLMQELDWLKASGLEIIATERPESELEAELRSGRRFDMAYRAGHCDEPVMDVGPLIAPAYDASPSVNPLASLASPRILQLLLQLERAPEYPTARALAIQIDRECRDELPILPLWQVEDHYAWHTRLKGPKQECDQLYEGITSWEIDPWIARDPW